MCVEPKSITIKTQCSPRAAPPTLRMRRTFVHTSDYLLVLDILEYLLIIEEIVSLVDLRL